MVLSTRNLKTVDQGSLYDRTMGPASIGRTIRRTRRTGPFPACSKLMRQQTRLRPCRSSRAQPTWHSTALAIDILIEATPPRSPTRYPLTVCALAARLAPEEGGAARAAASTLMLIRRQLHRGRRRVEAVSFGPESSWLAWHQPGHGSNKLRASAAQAPETAISGDTCHLRSETPRDQGWWVLSARPIFVPSTP